MQYMLLILEPHGQRATRTDAEGRAAYDKMLRYAENEVARRLERRAVAAHRYRRRARERAPRQAHAARRPVLRIEGDDTAATSSSTARESRRGRRDREPHSGRRMGDRRGARVRALLLVGTPQAGSRSADRCTMAMTSRSRDRAMDEPTFDFLLPDDVATSLRARLGQMFPVLTEGEIARIRRFGSRAPLRARRAARSRPASPDRACSSCSRACVAISQRDGLGHVVPIVRQRGRASSWPRSARCRAARRWSTAIARGRRRGAADCRRASCAR